MAERQLPKLNVAGSIPVSRSIDFGIAVLTKVIVEMRILLRIMVHFLWIFHLFSI